MGLAKATGSTRKRSNENIHYIRNTHETYVLERNEFIQYGDPEYSLLLLLLITECIKEYQESMQ